MKSPLAAILMRTSLAPSAVLITGNQPFSIRRHLQIPIFKILVDLRKIVSGPMLAQQESLDGRSDAAECRNVDGPRTHTPDGICVSIVASSACFAHQIYLTTSFAFTVLQSAALRTESMRLGVGLPSMLAPPPEAKYAKEFIKLKQLEAKAREIRGDGPVLGKSGVLAMDFEASFPGEYRKSTIQGSGIQFSLRKRCHHNIHLKAEVVRLWCLQKVHDNGVSAPLWQLVEQQEQQRKMQRAKEPVEPTVEPTITTSREYMPQFADEVMEKANRGEMPRATQIVDMTKSKTQQNKPLNSKRFNKKKADKRRR
jgi:hypothetical protein